jgi:hypothetical protein
MKPQSYIAMLRPQPPEDYEPTIYSVPEWASNIWFALIIIIPLILLKMGTFKDKNGSSFEGCLIFGFLFATITIFILNLIFLNAPQSDRRWELFLADAKGDTSFPYPPVQWLLQEPPAESKLLAPESKLLVASLSLSTLAISQL